MSSPIQEKEESRTDSPTYVINEYLDGVWKLKYMTHPSIGGPIESLKHWRATVTTVINKTIPIHIRIATDVFHISPISTIAFLGCYGWYGVHASLELYSTATVLRLLEVKLMSGATDASNADLLLALGLRLSYSMVSQGINWYIERIRDKLASKVKRHFEFIMLQVDLEVDLVASKEYANQTPSGIGNHVWNAFTDLASFIKDIIYALSQFLIIVKVVSSAGGPLFALMCIAYPMVAKWITQEYTPEGAIAYTYNDDYRRIEALKLLCGVNYRQDVLTNGMARWITREYSQSLRKLDGVPDGNPHQIMWGRPNMRPYRAMIADTLSNFPLVFCVFTALWYPGRFSVASVSILQQAAVLLRLSVSQLLRGSKRLMITAKDAEKLYEPSVIFNKIKDGTVAYPEEDSGSMAEGMHLELRNVSYTYSGSQNTAAAIDNVSLTIKPGSLVVIVGPNGSGKSTLVRLLARLYDPSSGEILIDGRQSSSYRIADLHRATALLSQDAMLYPLSLRENIGLGYPGNEVDDEMVYKSAHLGGASDLCDRLKHGLETVLDPCITCRQFNMGRNFGADHPLVKEMESLPKKIEVSGGEKQRIAAARTFMRFNSGSVRLVVVDEPSSALDAEGELQLFNNLLAARDGKTMVFVTHRFGHLTKHADSIIYLQDGRIYEQGSHSALMERNGEYSQLYNIQAAAFSDSDGTRWLCLRIFPSGVPTYPSSAVAYKPIFIPSSDPLLPCLGPFSSCNPRGFLWYPYNSQVLLSYFTPRR